MDVENNLDSNDSQKPTKIRFEYEDDEEAETIEEVATESSNLEEDSTMCELEDSLVGGDNKTSADYYFDSYSHFGTDFFFLEFCWLLIEIIVCMLSCTSSFLYIFDIVDSF